MDSRKSSLRKEIESATAVLVHEALWSCRRTVDLFSFQFGDRKPTHTFRGDEVKVGNHAINVQCAWRITKSEVVVVGAADVYFPPSSYPDNAEKKFDWKRERTRADEKLEALFENERRQFRVLQIQVGTAGSLHILMEDDLTLDIMPDESSDDEHWRLLVPIGGDFPLVISGNRLRGEVGIS
jgi:hypothetical protein